MKSIIATVALLTSFSAFSTGVQQSEICQGVGQASINQQKERIKSGYQAGEISNDLKSFFMQHIDEMQKNLDYICEGKRLSNDQELTFREQQLNRLQEGLRTGEVDAKLAAYFLENLKELK